MDDFAKFEGWGVIWTGRRRDQPDGDVKTYLSVWDTEEAARACADMATRSTVHLVAPMSELLKRCLAEHIDAKPTPSLADEAASVLVQLDELAEVWGDEGVFRRCRDRLRAAIAEQGAV